MVRVCLDSPCVHGSIWHAHSEVIDGLQDNDALFINEQACFDGVYNGIK